MIASYVCINLFHRGWCKYLWFNYHAKSWCKWILVNMRIDIWRIDLARLFSMFNCVNLFDRDWCKYFWFNNSVPILVQKPGANDYWSIFGGVTPGSKIVKSLKTSVKICANKLRKCLVDVPQLFARQLLSHTIVCEIASTCFKDSDHWPAPFPIRALGTFTDELAQWSPSTLLPHLGAELKSDDQDKPGGLGCQQRGKFIFWKFSKVYLSKVYFQSYYQLRPGGLGMSAAARL